MSVRGYFKISDRQKSLIFWKLYATSDNIYYVNFNIGVSTAISRHPCPPRLAHTSRQSVPCFRKSARKVKKIHSLLDNFEFDKIDSVFNFFLEGGSEWAV